MKTILILFILFISSSNSQIFIDTVFSFTPGTIQFAGQSPEYYPKNIFNSPSIYGTKYIAETRPEEILSIGLNGEIIIGLKNNLIIDKEGADFTIFENAFVNQFNEVMYAEPAIVSVSKDGINYIEFPYDILTLEGLAGTKPTIGANNPFNPLKSGGNPFDLATIGIDSVRYIKIKDITEQILNNSEHPNYDPTLSGFDLDAVAIINHSDYVSSVELISATKDETYFYDLLGNRINNLNNYSGLYFIYSNNNIGKYVK